MITANQLDAFPFNNRTDYKTIQRGIQYYRDGRVTDLQYHAEHAVCRVEGKNDDYRVAFSTNSQNQLKATCTCPQAAIDPICKHIVAAAMAFSNFLRTPAGQSNWQYRLGIALESAPQHKSIVHFQHYAMVLILYENEYYANYSYNLTTYVVKAKVWDRLQDYPPGNPAAVNKLLEEDTSWTKLIDNQFQGLNPAGCLNLSIDGIAAFEFINQQVHYFGRFAGFGPYLALLEHLDVPIFFMDGNRQFKGRLQVLEQAVEIKAALARDSDHLSLQAGIEREGQIFSSAKESLRVVSHEPAWVLFGNTLAPVANPESFDLLSILPLEIPASDEETFRSRYFRRIIEHVPVQSDLVQWDDITVNAIPRLYLHNDEGVLRADLRFGYDEYEVLPGRAPVSPLMVDEPTSWTMTRVFRQLEQEQHFYQVLTDTRYGLKRANSNYPYGTFEIRAHTHPYDFLMNCIPALTQAGFEIYGDKESLGKVNRNLPTLRVNITSGIDWFELEAVVLYGDQEIKLNEIRKAIKKGQSYIKLADGSVGQIPETWLERYKHLFNLAEETEGGLRINELQLPLVDELLEDASQVNKTAEYEQKRQRLQSFENIRPQPVPQNFTGELRPYQKAGLDWLHFLREYNFGGILADDMGLGKTIQVLAFLQSLCEQSKRQAASLLIVPKSLLTNWQRESARFTPGLRILEYMGNFRNKDPESFDDYDIVLTTYGTMLRDIELLRKYRFDYVILDESQAIKNPLAQSAKAIRLINAAHRLAMTGTPVENNTFELWSQFAFINPGLLGGMDYFRREFATPIESRQDDQTAGLLKRMVYPFILRRTKAQVAPELPPRTERVIYTDLEPAQRKLYNHTRDYYRAQLLGMIDKEGLDNTRMKILEGLLRLRQICIHPALVEPGYNKSSAKFEVLLETLATLQSEGHKTLVFSQFVQSLHLLETELHKIGLSYTYLDGKTKNRQECVDRFQNEPDLACFLISLKAGGVGLNLTAADYVIHLDPWWNPAVEMQAADRAHRIGQDKPVFIYKIIARETVEEKILELQNRKKELVQQLISSEGSFFKSLTRDDVKVLFS